MLNEHFSILKCLILIIGSRSHFLSCMQGEILTPPFDAILLSKRILFPRLGVIKHITGVGSKRKRNLTDFTFVWRDK